MGRGPTRHGGVEDVALHIARSFDAKEFSAPSDCGENSFFSAKGDSAKLPIICVIRIHISYMSAKVLAVFYNKECDYESSSQAGRNVPL